MNNQKRLEASCRRLKFEFINCIGIFRLINIIPGLQIKEPFKTMFERSKKK